jgi:hypothetical protein
MREGDAESEVVMWRKRRGEESESLEGGGKEKSKVQRQERKKERIKTRKRRGEGREE